MTHLNCELLPVFFSVIQCHPSHPNRVVSPVVAPHRARMSAFFLTSVASFKPLLGKHKHPPKKQQPRFDSRWFFRFFCIKTWCFFGKKTAPKLLGGRNLFPDFLWISGREVDLNGASPNRYEGHESQFFFHKIDL